MSLGTLTRISPGMVSGPVLEGACWEQTLCWQGLAGPQDWQEGAGGSWVGRGLWVKGAGRREVVGAGTDTGCAHSKRGGSCCLPSSLSRGTH